jgi:hypothetical protein
MRRHAVVAWAGVAALALLSWGAPARAATSYQAWLVVTDPSIHGTYWLDIPVAQTVMANGTTEGTIANWTYNCTLQANLCSTGGFQINNLNVTLSPDPSISFGTSAVNFGATSATFGFVFQQSIVPTVAPGIASSSLSGSTTKGGGSPGSVSIAPAPPPAGIPQNAPGTKIMVYNLSTNGGTTWQNAGIDLGPAFTSNPSLVSDTYGPFNSPSVAGPAGSGSYDTMRVDVNFKLSGGGDRLTFNGDATIVEQAATPEPSTAAQVAVGMLGIGLVRRRWRG